MSTGTTNADVSLPKPPFVDIEGVINCRIVGGYSTSDPCIVVKPVGILRSGDPSRITDRGKEQLVSLGVRRIFDLRADTEVSAYSSARASIPGVEFVKVPISEKEAFDPVNLALRLKQFHERELETFLDLYHEILELGAGAYEVIFKHLIERPNELCLVHCTAGKDRAGLFTTLLMLVLGVPDEQIVQEYILTNVGLAPALPGLTARFMQNDVYRENWDGVMNMGSARSETMIATLKMIREKYGSAEGYLKSHTNIKDEDIQKLRENLLQPV
ncbi:hypothetical protein K435DRAFT_773023 [Dendrothele bispora CBS 962.96]|uniref:Tyrosine specific protein phosphatases domain-containing protein n=1 Tax=Dendrothele bispora (strain CBS 962.96) TaxID=1314807 RepID=A0A4S8MW36_DENBC|nr:hypothetical protein K435DRAFT_773023 [Dendrothele bispora CBS 962.96]